MNIKQTLLILCVFITAPILQGMEEEKKAIAQVQQIYGGGGLACPTTNIYINSSGNPTSDATWANTLRIQQLESERSQSNIATTICGVGAAWYFGNSVQSFVGKKTAQGWGSLVTGSLLSFVAYNNYSNGQDLAQRARELAEEIKKQKNEA